VSRFAVLKQCLTTDLTIGCQTDLFNRTDADVTVKIKTTGAYTDIKRMM